MVSGTGEDKKTRVLDAVRLRSDNLQAIIDRLFSIVLMWGVTVVRLETVAFQRLLKFAFTRR